MDTSRNDLLGELAADAVLERSDFLVQASGALRRFLDSNSQRINELGGLVLIDDDVDYLAIAPDLTFRSRSRYQDETTGEWLTETEVIESPAELVELYNLADVFQAFAEAAKAGAGLEDEPTATPDLLRTADVAPEETIPLGGENPYAAAADDWAAAQDEGEAPADEEDAAQRLYDLALAFQERSQQTEAHLVEQFERRASRLTSTIGDLIILDDEDERLTLRANGSFTAEVVPEAEDGAGEWRRLDTPDELVEFYDPTDVFGDLADTLAEAYPAVGGDEDVEDDGTDGTEGATAEGEEGEESEDGDEESEDGDEEGEGPEDAGHR